MEIEGEEYDFDMNKYSDGMLEQIKSKLEESKKSLAACEKVEEAYKTYEVIANLEEELNYCEKYARNEFAKSIGLEITSQKVMEILERGNFETTGGGFINGDERESVLLNFENGSGEKVGISLMPSEDAQKPKFIIESFGGNGNVTKASVIYDLQENGYDVSDQTQDGSCHLYNSEEKFEKFVTELSKQNKQQTQN